MISIIMPAYNIKARKQTRAVKQCLRSIMKQTYPYWELLISDGGCTDTTMSIISEWCKHDPRISIVPDTLHYWRLGGITHYFHPEFLERYVTSYKLKLQQIERLHLPFEYLHATAIELIHSGVDSLRLRARFAPPQRQSDARIHNKCA